MSRADNKERYKKYDHDYYIKHRRPKSKIGQAEQQIDDLEAKLAESEKEIKTLICNYESRITKEQELMSWLEHNNEELKQQLTDYKKDNEQLEDRLHTAEQEALHFQNKYFDMQYQLAEKEKEMEIYRRSMEVLVEKCENHNKDKISFCIEKLEKVKEKLIDEIESVTELIDPLEYEDYHELIGCSRGYKNSVEEIDNQIKQLKEENK